jgi:predicted metal-dependent phosphoesterase TrpH
MPVDTPVRLDLHVHASERSGCAVSPEEDQIRSAIAAGMQGMAFTDHFALVGPARLAELNLRYAPFRIYTGIEVTANHEDWLVLGLYDPALQREGWDYAELVDFVHRRDGFIILAHPFRYAPFIHADFERQPPDGIEIASYNTPAARETEIRALAARYNLALLRNSDAHQASRVGQYYNEVATLPVDDPALVALLKTQRL